MNRPLCEGGDWVGREPTKDGKKPVPYGPDNKPTFIKEGKYTSDPEICMYMNTYGVGKVADIILDKQGYQVP